MPGESLIIARKQMELGEELHARVTSYKTGQTPRFWKISHADREGGDVVFTFSVESVTGMHADPFAEQHWLPGRVRSGPSLCIDSKEDRLFEGLSVIAKKVSIASVEVSVPDGAILATDVLEMREGASLKGSTFTVVAGEIRGGTIDLSVENGGGGRDGSDGRNFVLVAENVVDSSILANGGKGLDGLRGAPEIAPRVYHG